MRIKKYVAILTGGGDAVGLNAAIAAVTRVLCQMGYAVSGIIAGWKGLTCEGGADKIPLNRENVDGIVREGGTIIHTSREDPRKDQEKYDNVITNLKIYTPQREVYPGYILVAAGGDDTLGVATKLSQEGLPVIGIPKTMDLDLSGTDYEEGFWSYVDSVFRMNRNFITTCRSHRRVGVLEVFGRHSGFTAAAVGIALDADFIIIPEFELDLDQLAMRVKEAYAKRPYALVVVEEGLKIEAADTAKVDGFGNELLREKRIGDFIAREIEQLIGIETRANNASHPHRGDPGAYDAIAGFRLGLKAAELVQNKQWGMMAAFKGDEVIAVPIESHAPRRVVTLESDWGKLVIGRNTGQF